MVPHPLCLEPERGHSLLRSFPESLAPAAGDSMVPAEPGKPQVIVISLFMAWVRRNVARGLHAPRMRGGEPPSATCGRRHNRTPGTCSLSGLGRSKPATGGNARVAVAR